MKIVGCDLAEIYNELTVCQLFDGCLTTKGKLSCESFHRDKVAVRLPLSITSTGAAMTAILRVCDVCVNGVFPSWAHDDRVNAFCVSVCRGIVLPASIARPNQQVR
jgi:hypothetical protein